MKQPSEGRVVYFYSSNGLPPGPYAAVVSAVHGEGRVTLHVFDPAGGVAVQRDVPYSETPTAGAWTWPVGVPP